MFASCACGGRAERLIVRKSRIAGIPAARYRLLRKPKDNLMQRWQLLRTGNTNTSAQLLVGATNQVSDQRPCCLDLVLPCQDMKHTIHHWTPRTLIYGFLETYIRLIYKQGAYMKCLTAAAAAQQQRQYRSEHKSKQHKVNGCTVTCLQHLLAERIGVSSLMQHGNNMATARAPLHHY
jgi:hypothetical protein